MKIYITKYALTSGIIEDEGKETEINGMIKAVGMNMLILKPDWHESREEAVKRANVMILQQPHAFPEKESVFINWKNLNRKGQGHG